MFNWATISANAQTMRGVIEQMQNARLHSIGVESVGASAALYRQICESRRNYNSVASSLTNRTVEPSPCRAGPGRAGWGRSAGRARPTRAGRADVVSLRSPPAPLTIRPRRRRRRRRHKSRGTGAPRQRCLRRHGVRWRIQRRGPEGRAATLNPNP